MGNTVYTCPEPTCRRRFRQAPAYDRHLKKHINDGHYLVDVSPAGLRRAQRAALPETTFSRRRVKSVVPGVQAVSRPLGVLAVPVRKRNRPPSSAIATPRSKRLGSVGSSQGRGHRKKQQQAEAAEELLRRQRRRKRVFMRIASGQVGSSASGSRKGKTAIVDLRSPSPERSPAHALALETPQRQRSTPPPAVFLLTPDTTVRAPSSSVESDTDVLPLLPPITIPPASPVSPTTLSLPKWATRPITPLPLDDPINAMEQDNLQPTPEDEEPEEEDELDWDEPADEARPGDSGAGDKSESIDLDAGSSVVSSTSAGPSTTPQVRATGSNSVDAVELVDAMVFGYRLPSGHGTGIANPPHNTPEEVTAGQNSPPSRQVSPFKNLSPRHKRPQWCIFTSKYHYPPVDVDIDMGH